MGIGGKSDVNLDMIKFMIEQIQKAQQPVLDQLHEVNGRLSKIEQRLEEGDRRLGEHSDFIAEVAPILDRCRKSSHHPPSTTTALERKPRRLHWIIIVIASGALTWLGEHITPIIINALAEKPAPPVTKQIQ